MHQALYLDDSYCKEFIATVIKVEGNQIILDKTAFYPTSGGQLHDTGTLRADDVEFNVLNVTKKDGNIVHEIDKPRLAEGIQVHGYINWQRRYMLMRYHTAAHIISQVIHRRTGALVTGNNLDPEKGSIDYALSNYDPEKMKEYIEEANAVIAQNLKITQTYMPRSEVEKDPTLCKLAKGLPEGIAELRILAIGDFDVQADGGTHVHSTKEIGRVEIIKCENKGKDRRRLYFVVKD